MAQNKKGFTEKEYADIGRIVVSALRKNASQTIKAYASCKAALEEERIRPV